MRCEDFPCCGHEAGGCPQIDENGAERFHCARCSVLMAPKARSAVCEPCHSEWRRYMVEDRWLDSMDEE